MILSAHQPCFFPWLGLFDKIARADKFCILDTVQYEHRGWQNRNQILTRAGPLMLSVPVESKDHANKMLNEIRVIPGRWQKKHVRSIELAYQAAPYYDLYIESVRDILLNPPEILANLNMRTIMFAVNALGIKTPIVNARDYDFRGNKSELVLDMCQRLKATTYVFGSQGADYADLEAFARAGIGLEFQEYRHPTYSQQWGRPFVPNLSVLDLLFNVGPTSLKVLSG